MAVKIYRVGAGADGNFGSLFESDQTAASRTDGWTVAKIASAFSAEFKQATKQPSTAFTLQSTTAKPASFLTGAGVANAFKAPLGLNGTFAATAWTLAFAVRAGTASSQAGRVRVRVFKSANADGSSAVELTTSTLVGGTTAALSTTADATSSVSWSPGALTLNSEYLFFVVAWETTTASGSNNGDVLIRTGQSAAGSFLTTPNFTAATPVTYFGTTAIAATFSATTQGTAQKVFKPQFGVSCHISLLSTQAAANARAVVYKAAGMTLLREDAAWSVHEPTSSGGYVFAGSRVERTMTAAQAAGLKVVVQAGYAPSWANGGNASDKVGPTAAFIPRYGAYVRALAAYCEANFPGVCIAIEYWNEPNINFLIDPATGVQATGGYYTSLVKAAWNYVRGISPANTNAGPNIELWGGTTADVGNGHVSGSTWLDFAFLNQCVAAGIVGFYDAWSTHPYNWSLNMGGIEMSSISNGGPAEHTLWTAPSIASILAAAGDLTSKIHATEWGASLHAYPSGTPVGPFGSAARSMSEYEEAIGFDIFFAYWKAQARAGHLFIYTGEDYNSAETTDEQNHFGLYHDAANSYSAKPIVQKMQAYLPRTIVGTPGSGTPDPTLITDATRLATALTLGQSYDGRGKDSSFGFYEPITNYVKNGTAQTGGGAWNLAAGVTVTRDTTIRPPGPGSATFAARRTGSIGTIDFSQATADTAAIPTSVAGEKWSASLWVKGKGSAIGQAVLIALGESGVGESAGPSVNLDGNWQRLWINRTLAAGSTQLYIHVYMPGVSTIAIGDGFNIAYLSITKTVYPAPYIHTDGAVQLSIQPRVQVPSSGFPALDQGWIKATLRMGFDSSDIASVQAGAVTLLSIPRSDFVTNSVVFNYLGGSFTIYRSALAASGAGGSKGVPATFKRGDLVTVIAAWSGNTLKLSVNGQPFVADTAQPPSVTETYAPQVTVGRNAFGGEVITAEVMNISAGIDALTDADVVNFSVADREYGLPGERFYWAADDPTYYLIPPPSGTTYFGSTTTSITDTITTQARRQTFTSTTTAISFSATTASRRKTTSAISVPIVFAATTAARKRTTSATTTPTTFGAVTAGVRTSGAQTVQVGGVFPSGWVPSITGLVTSGDGHLVGGGYALQFGVPTAKITTTTAPGGVTSAQAFGSVTVKTATTKPSGGVGSAQAFGTVTIKTTVTTPVTGLGSAQSFGAIKTGVTRTTGGVTSAQTFGAVTISTATKPAVGGVPSAQAFGVVTIGGAIRPAVGGVSSAQAFGAVLVRATVTRSITGLGSAQTFGSVLVITAGKTPVFGVISAQAFGALTIVTGGVIKPSGGVTSAQAFGTPLASSGGPPAQFVSVAGRTSAQAFGAVTAKSLFTRTVTGLSSAQSFGALSTSTRVTKLIGGVSSAQAFGALSPRASQRVTVPGVYGAGLANLPITGLVITGDGHLVGGQGLFVAFGTPTIKTGSTTIPVGGVSSAQRFGGFPVKVSGVRSAQAFGQLRVQIAYLHDLICTELDLAALACAELDLNESDYLVFDLQPIES